MSSSKIEREKRTAELMIRLYCRKKEKNQELCDSCKALMEYAFARLDRCPFGENKTACKQCTVHCYKPQMREKMKLVMRYSGPRMLLYSPGAALRHMMESIPRLSGILSAASKSDKK